MEIAGNYRDKTPHIVEHLDKRSRVLFVPESTEGIEAGQMTAMNGEEKVGIVANGAGEHGENIA